MAFSVLGSVNKQSTNATSATTAGLNTSGADLIIVVVACELLAAGSLPTDSKSNTWTPLTKYNNGARAMRAFICLSPTTDAAHTFSFTVTGSETTPSLAVLAVSGAQQSSQPDKSATSSNNQLPSTTPSSNNELVITYICTRNTPPLGAPSGGYTTTALLDSTANADGIGLGYLIQTTAAATAPLWGANDANRVTGLNSFFASTATVISVPAGSLSLTGFAPADSTDIPVPAGALTLTGRAPALQPTIEVPAGSLSLTGFAPVLDATIPVPAGSLTLTGFAPTEVHAIPVPAAALAFTTYPPKLVFSTGGGTSAAAGWWFAGPAARMIADAGFLLLVKPVLEERERERRGDAGS